MNVSGPSMRLPKSSPDREVAIRFAWSVNISWIIVATAIAELETGHCALSQSRDQRALMRSSHSLSYPVASPC